MKTDHVPGWAEGCWGAGWGPRVAQGASGRFLWMPRGCARKRAALSGPELPWERTCGLLNCKFGQRFNFYDSSLK